MTFISNLIGVLALEVSVVSILGTFLGATLVTGGFAFAIAMLAAVLGLANIFVNCHRLSAQNLVSNGMWMLVSGISLFIAAIADSFSKYTKILLSVYGVSLDFGAFALSTFGISC